MNKCFLCGKEFDSVISHKICSKGTKNIYEIRWVKCNQKELKLCSDCTRAVLFGASTARECDFDFEFKLVGIVPRYYEEK